MTFQPLYFRMRSWWNDEGRYIERTECHELGPEHDTLSSFFKNHGSGIFWVADNPHGRNSIKLCYFDDKSVFYVGSCVYHNLSGFETYLNKSFDVCFIGVYFDIDDGDSAE